MLNEAKLPDGYWREEVHTTIYVQNTGYIRVIVTKLLIFYGLEDHLQLSILKFLEVNDK